MSSAQLPINRGQKMAHDKNKGVRRPAPAVRALRAKNNIHRRHWPASFLWRSPANARLCCRRIDSRNTSSLYGRPLPWKASLLDLWRARLARGLTAFFWASVLRAFGGCSPLRWQPPKARRTETMNQHPFAPLFMASCTEAYLSAA